eukprot:TRINITY_DN7684_c0_g2_i2.p1 TRINITY_DN7684_c0_g2~~TRINITY_DN7684_c0_g2_i2.p1  ORF type:complete len:151 (-),score=45.82 TRINITY_DN7684_c0_g2_i2:41-493(-)
MPSLVGSEMCIRDRYQRRVHGNSVALSKDGKYVVSGDQNGSIKAWNYESGEEVKTFQGDGSKKNSVTFSKDGKYIVIGCDNGKIKVMNTETKKYVKTLVGHSESVNSVTISSVSYTHLTLPTICSVQISVVAVSLKQKKKQNTDQQMNTQ